MDKIVILAKDGIFRSADEGKRYPLESILPYMGAEVLCEGMTMGTLFSLIEQDKAFFALLFHIDIGGWELDPFFDEMKQPLTEEEQNNISIYKAVRIHWYVFYDKTNKPELYIEPTIHVDAIEKDGSTEHYASDFMRVSHMRELPIVLDEEVRINDDMGTYENIIVSNRKFSLYEIIKAILTEITFNGSPGRRESIANKIKLSIDEMDKSTDKEVDKIIEQEDYEFDDGGGEELEDGEARRD
jgi:hypothetical protein